MARKHTPLPWKIHQTEDRLPIPIIGKSCEFIAECSDDGSLIRASQAWDNARFIVRACNSHYELVEALEAILGDNMTPAGEPGHIDYGQACKMARSALAKAKGG